MQGIIRLVKFALQSSLRNFWLSFVTTSVMVLTLLTINAIITLNVLAQKTIASVEDTVQVEIYFNDGTSDDIQGAVRGYLLGLPQVKDVVIIDEETSLENFKKIHADDPEILAALEEVGGNPIGDSLLISAQQPEDFPFILEAVQSPEFSPYIKETNFADHAVVIEKLSNFAVRVKWGGIVLASFFGLISMLIVFNTIRVAIYVHRDEIAVMKLVGAKDWLVRGPFLLEAVLYSAVATAIMAGLLVVALRALEPSIGRFFSGVDIGLSEYYWQHAVVIFGLQFVVLSVLSMATTWMAMRKHLKT